MNKKTYDTVINWISKENGGRISGIPFKRDKYAPLISIDGSMVFNKSVWSVLCYSYEYLGLLRTRAYLRFLNNDDAPSNILFIGTKFELFEGSKKVASGEIISESDYVFNLKNE